MTRTIRTPRQRAEEQLALDDRTVTRLGKQRTKLRADLKAVETEYDDAVARREHAKQHPDLAGLTHPRTTTSTPGGTTA